MPTSSTSSTASSSSTPKAAAVSAQDLADQLASASTTTIYVDLPGMDDKAAAALLAGDPPLHVEHDGVRDKWAVRKATDEEVAEATAPSSTSTTTSSSTTA